MAPPARREPRAAGGRFAPLPLLPPHGSATDEDGDEGDEERAMLERLTRMEAGVQRLELAAASARDAGAPARLAAERAALHAATERTFERLRRVYVDCIVTESGHSLAGISRPEGRLFYAAYYGLPSAIRELIRAGEVGINQGVGRAGGTAVLVACRRGNERCVAVLIELGAYVHPFTVYCEPGAGSTLVPLVAAATQNRVGAARLLLAHGVDVNAVCEGAPLLVNGTALGCACAYGSVGMVRLLLEQEGIDASGKAHVRGDERWYTALEVAERNTLRNPPEDIDEIRGMLEAHVGSSAAPPAGVRPGCPDDPHNAVIMGDGPGSDDESADGDLAITDGDDEDEMIRLLHELEAQVVRLEAAPPGLPVDRALGRLRRRTARVLEVLGTVYDDFIVTDFSWSRYAISCPQGQLYYAAVHGLRQLIRDLVAGGRVGINAVVGRYGGTALCAAARAGQVGSVETLISLGADVHARRRCGETNALSALTNSVTSVSNGVGCARTLLAAGTDVNEVHAAQGIYTGTSLGAACFVGAVESVRLLLAQDGVDIHAACHCYTEPPLAPPPPSGRTALEATRLNQKKNPEENMEEIREMLMRHLRRECIQLAREHLISHALQERRRGRPSGSGGGRARGQGGSSGGAREGGGGDAGAGARPPRMHGEQHGEAHETARKGGEDEDESDGEIDDDDDDDPGDEGMEEEDAEEAALPLFSSQEDGEGDDDDEEEDDDGVDNPVAGGEDDDGDEDGEEEEDEEEDGDDGEDDEDEEDQQIQLDPSYFP